MSPIQADFLAAGEAVFWQRMRQLKDEHIPCSVTVHAVQPKGLTVTFAQRRGFIRWRNAGALRGVADGDGSGCALVGQQVTVFVANTSEAGGRLEFTCTPLLDVKVGQALTGVVLAVGATGALIDYGDTHPGVLHLKYFSRERVRNLAVGHKLRVSIHSVDVVGGRRRVQLSTSELFTRGLTDGGMASPELTSLAGPASRQAFHSGLPTADTSFLSSLDAEPPAPPQLNATANSLLGKTQKTIGAVATARPRRLLFGLAPEEEEEKGDPSALQVDGVASAVPGRASRSVIVGGSGAIDDDDDDSDDDEDEDDSDDDDDDIEGEDDGGAPVVSLPDEQRSMPLGLKLGFWTRMRQLGEDDIAVLVTVLEVNSRGLIVVFDDRRGFILWKNAVGTLKGGRLSDGRVHRGDVGLVGQQLMAVVLLAREESGTLEFKCRPHPGSGREVQVGEVVTGVVTRLQKDNRFDGAWVDYGDSNVGFLSTQYFSQSHVANLDKHVAAGDELKVVVRSRNSKGNVTLSTKWLERVPGAMLRHPRLLFDTAEEAAAEKERYLAEVAAAQELTFDFQVGQLVTGVVRRVETFGAFVDYGDTIDGLLHVSEISQARVADASDVLFQGDEIKAIICSIDRPTGRVRLSSKWLERWPGAMLRRPRLLFATAREALQAEALHIRQETTGMADNDLDFPPDPHATSRSEERILQKMASLSAGFNHQEGQLVTGVVRNVQAYGAFFDFGANLNVSGRLHISEISQAPVVRVSDHLAVGDVLKVIVGSIDLESGRVNLSCKWLERTPGDMLWRRPRLLLETADEAAEAKASFEDQERQKEAKRMELHNMRWDERSKLPHLGQDAREYLGPATSMGHDFKEGQLVTGVVRSALSYGAFVDYGGATEGLLHAKEISRAHVQDASRYLAKGDVLKVVIQRIQGGGRVNLSTRWLERTPGAMLQVPLAPWLLYETAEEAAVSEALHGQASGRAKRASSRVEADQLHHEAHVAEAFASTSQHKPGHPQTRHPLKFLARVRVHTGGVLAAHAPAEPGARSGGGDCRSGPGQVPGRLAVPAPRRHLLAQPGRAAAVRNGRRPGRTAAHGRPRPDAAGPWAPGVPVPASPLGPGCAGGAAGDGRRAERPALGRVCGLWRRRRGPAACQPGLPGAGHRHENVPGHRSSGPGLHSPRGHGAKRPRDAVRPAIVLGWLAAIPVWNAMFILTSK